MTDTVPFSNGTEAEAWQAVWCEHCTHDHDISHSGSGGDGGCRILLDATLGASGEEWRWPEAWVPEPEALGHNLPSLMLCGMFEPCHKGSCNGDPLADQRVHVRAAVEAAYRAERAS